MTELLHILDRAFIHFFSACSLVMLVFFGLRTVQRRVVGVWLPSGWQHLLLISAFMVFALASLREAFDVAHGQTTAKAIVDYLSWLAGCGVSAWGLYRFKSDK